MKLDTELKERRQIYRQLSKSDKNTINAVLDFINFVDRRYTKLLRTCTKEQSETYQAFLRFLEHLSKHIENADIELKKIEDKIKMLQEDSEMLGWWDHIKQHFAKKEKETLKDVLEDLREGMQFKIYDETPSSVVSKEV